ncbi:hypothetical protein LEMLEM_LOCUS11810 [Lemmus lemmus]
MERVRHVERSRHGFCRVHGPVPTQDSCHLPKSWHRAVTGCDWPELIFLMHRLAERELPNAWKLMKEKFLSGPPKQKIAC